MYRMPRAQEAYEFFKSKINGFPVDFDASDEIFIVDQNQGPCVISFRSEPYTKPEQANKRDVALWVESNFVASDGQSRLAIPGFHATVEIVGADGMIYGIASTFDESIILFAGIQIPKVQCSFRVR